jgi:predicted Zn-dependent protease
MVAPARRPAPKPKEKLPAPRPALYRVDTPEVAFDGPLGTEVLDTLARVRACAVEASPAGEIAPRTLKDARGYSSRDLHALAEVAYHYLFSGGERIAEVFFEGLSAIAPDEAYFALALGLTYDRLGKTEAAWASYRRAAALDPEDPRAELNLAELALERGDNREARTRLLAALGKAKRRRELELVRKAEALLSRVSVGGAR